jgi:hypothetical protein
MNGMGGPGGDMNEMSMQISFRMMNNTMKGCFEDCVTDFSGADLSGSEQSCLKNCAIRSVTAMQVMSQLQETAASRQGGGF